MNLFDLFGQKISVGDRIRYSVNGFIFTEKILSIEEGGGDVPSVPLYFKKDQVIFSMPSFDIRGDQYVDKVCPKPKVEDEMARFLKDVKPITSPLRVRMANDMIQEFQSMMQDMRRS